MQRQQSLFHPQINEIIYIMQIYCSIIIEQSENGSLFFVQFEPFFVAFCSWRKLPAKSRHFQTYSATRPLPCSTEVTKLGAHAPHKNLQPLALAKLEGS